MFYRFGRRSVFKRYVGLSCVLHAVVLLGLWSVVKSQIKVMRTTGVEIAIRTMPGMPKPAIPPKPRPGAGPMPSASLPGVAPRRKIGRIIEKKFNLDMPKIEPQTAMRRSGREDEVQMAKDKNIAKFIRAENVELIDIERKDVYQPPAPPAPVPQTPVPQGEYVPPTAQTLVDVNIQFVEVEFEASKIDIDAVQWSPAVALKPSAGAEGSPGLQAAPAGDPAGRKALKVFKPDLPPNMGIQEPKVEVILRIVIAESGFVSTAEIERSGGYLELDNLALAAVRQWIYESAPKKDVKLVRFNYVF